MGHGSCWAQSAAPSFVKLYKIGLTVIVVLSQSWEFFYFIFFIRCFETCNLNFHFICMETGKKVSSEL